MLWFVIIFSNHFAEPYERINKRALRVVLQHRVYLPAEFVLEEQVLRSREPDEVPTEELAGFLQAELSPRQRELALTAAAAVAADYAGVDLMIDPGGADHVIEVNGIPGWRGLQRATDVDVAGSIADALLARVAAGARPPVRV